MEGWDGVGGGREVQEGGDITEVSGTVKILVIVYLGHQAFDISS